MYIKINYRISITSFINLLITIMFSLIVIFYMKDSTWVTYEIIAILSVISLVYQILFLRIKGFKIYSFQPLFLIMSHLFCFSFMWLVAIGKEEFIFFPTWIYTDQQLKIQTALFCIINIQAVFTGMILIKAQNKKWYPKIPTNQRVNMLFRMGVILFFFGLPFKLIYDYFNILNTISGGYSAFSMTGFIDDLQHFLIVGIIFIISSRRYNTKKNFCILLCFLGYCAIVMLFSGDRRYYIIAIIATTLAYKFSTLKDANKKNRKCSNIIKFVLVFFVGLFFLNMTVYIRYNRFSSMGVEQFLNSGMLFSFDGIWECLGEFGVTLTAVSNALQLVPQELSFQLGASYIKACVYILPIGWLISIPNASIGSTLEELSGSPVGGAYLADLFANFGWYSIIASCILGIILTLLIKQNKENDEVTNAINCALAYILFNYIRSSASEVIRPVAYILIAFWILYKLINKEKLKK